MSEKFIVTAALTGAIHTPTMSPHLPITPDELGQGVLKNNFEWSVCAAGQLIQLFLVKFYQVLKTNAMQLSAPQQVADLEWM